MNESLRGVIKELHEEAQSNSLILNQAKVKLQESKEQKKQLTLKNEDLEKEMKKLDEEQSSFIDKIKVLEKQEAHQFQMAGHELAVLTQDSFNDLMIELNEMNCKCAEQEEQMKSFHVLKKSCEEKEAKIVELTKMYTDRIESSDKEYQERISYLSRMLGRKNSELEEEERIMKSNNDELKSELDIKSKQIEKSKKEISTLKGTITKNKKTINEYEDKLEKIFNKINDKQNG